MEVAPVAPSRLLDGAGLLIRNGAAAFDPLELLQKLLLVDGTRGRIDRGRLLGRDRNGQHGEPYQRQRPQHGANACNKRRHVVPPGFFQGAAGRPRAASPTYVTVVKTQWFRGKRSANPKRPSRSRASSPVPCRSGR